MSNMFRLATVSSFHGKLYSHKSILFSIVKPLLRWHLFRTCSGLRTATLQPWWLASKQLWPQLCCLQLFFVCFMWDKEASNADLTLIFKFVMWIHCIDNRELLALKVTSVGDASYISVLLTEDLLARKTLLHFVNVTAGLSPLPIWSALHVFMRKQSLVLVL